MEKVVKSGSDLVRRTAPLKVLIGLLYRELEGAKNADAVTVNRELFESVVTTLECVIEDIEARAPKAEARPAGIEAARVAVNRS
ncbi:MAG: hypothetical protein EXS13_01830 [Planctomycetes bacterium]|nr:hypothetical protein [Planctomycetota bacterium]